MLAMSWQLPRAPLRDRALLLLVLGTAVTGLLADGASVLVATGGLYRLKATAVFAGIAAIALGHLRDHHPFGSLGPANLMTSGRAMLVGLTAALIGAPVTQGTALLAAVLGVIVTLLDGVDGWLARRSRMSSAFGARYDMEVDALLILALAVLAWQHGKAGAWIVLAGLMRYMFLGAGWVWRWMNAPLPPSVRRKAVCVVQIGGLSAVVSPLLAAPASAAIAAGTLAVLSYSFLVDVLWLRRHGA
jgi:phosphatidylglycerophosphate synthase